MYWADEYESSYDSEYGGLYDQTFVFYDDDELSEESFEIEYENDDADDVILEEVPFVYCPAREDVGLA